MDLCGKTQWGFAPEVFCLFTLVLFAFICSLYIFTFTKAFRVLIFGLEPLLVKLLSPQTQPPFSRWCCLTSRFINKQLPLERKSPKCPPHGATPYSRVSAAYLFKLLRLKYCVHFCRHLNDLSYFFFHVSLVFSKCFSNIYCQTSQQPINRVNVISPILQMRLREFPEVTRESGGKRLAIVIFLGL